MSMTVDSSVQVSNIYFDSQIMDVIGDAVIMAFQTSEKHRYHVTCPKEFILSSSKYMQDILDLTDKA